MSDLEIDDKLIKQSLTSAKTIAMIGVSSVKKEDKSNVIRRPSIIVMNYLQEFGYKVIPVNPFAAGKKINGEVVMEKMEDIKEKIDIVNVFRPSKEATIYAEQAIKIKTKVLWLQYGIHSDEAKAIADKENVEFISNRCIKQEYQKLFQKSNPVFPVLKD